MAYNPSLHTTTNKPLGVAQPVSTDARSYYYDATEFSYRPYASKAEVFDYLETADQRTGHFPIFITDGDKVHAWWFKNGTEEDDLRRMDGIDTVVGVMTGEYATNAGEMYNWMVVTPLASVSGVKIGTSENGDDIEPGTDMVAGQSYSYRITQYFSVAGAFYFTNIGTFDLIIQRDDI
jgi:hypothetical protein